VTAHVLVRGIRIELDDEGMRVERDGHVYTVAWRAGAPAGDVPPPVPVGDAAGGCTCLTGFPYPLPCPVHPAARVTR
jgi:hypothetical protein